jgi:hypothetical protein
MLTWPAKDPDEAVLYGVDFAERLDSGAALSVATWTISPAGLTQGSATVDGAVASVKISGGALGDAYLVTCRATTSDGQTLEETAILEIRGR